MQPKPITIKDIAKIRALIAQMNLSDQEIAELRDRHAVKHTRASIIIAAAAQAILEARHS